MFVFDEALLSSGTPDIRVLGIGGAGIYISQQVANGELPFRFYSLDSNKSCLSENLSGEGILLGQGVNPSGLGAGSDLDTGQRFANDSRKAIAEVIADADMLFLVAGLGGGIGSGALPFIVAMAEDLGIPTVCFVTMPFNFEGGRRNKNAQLALQQVESSAAALIVLSHDLLLSSVARNLPFVEAMAKSGQLLASIIQRVLALSTSVGLINIDFSDLRTLLSRGGHLYVGEALAEGNEGAVEQAILRAAANPQLTQGELGMNQVQGVMVNLEIGAAFKLGDLNAVGEYITQLTSAQTEVMLGVSLIPDWHNQVRVTLMAMGNKQQTLQVESSHEMINIADYLQGRTA